jgi:hypothetical protein
MYSGKKALVKVGGAPTAMLDEPTTNVGGDNKTYQITNTSKQILDKDTPITVEVDGIAVSSGFVVDTLSGTVVFDAAAVRTVAVSGDYIPTSAAAECKEWSLNISGESIDTTKFQDDWNTRIQGLKSAEGSLSRWLTTDRYFYNALISGAPIIVELYPQDSLRPDRLWAIINSDEMSAAIDGANEEAVSFESSDRMLMNYV